MQPHENIQSIENRTDGSTVVRFKNGNTITLKGKDIEMDLVSVRKIGVKNIAEIESYAINTIAGSRSHVIRFINGGLLKFAYTQKNEIIDLEAENLAGQLVNGDEVIYSIA